MSEDTAPRAGSPGQALTHRLPLTVTLGPGIEVVIGSAQPSTPTVSGRPPSHGRPVPGSDGTQKPATRQYLSWDDLAVLAVIRRLTGTPSVATTMANLAARMHRAPAALAPRIALLHDLGFVRATTMGAAPIWLHPRAAMLLDRVAAAPPPAAPRTPAAPGTAPSRPGPSAPSPHRAAARTATPLEPPADTRRLPRRLQILAIVEASMQQRGGGPTMRELCAMTDYRSADGVYGQVALLVEQGLLQREPHRQPLITERGRIALGGARHLMASMARPVTTVE